QIKREEKFRARRSACCGQSTSAGFRLPARRKQLAEPGLDGSLHFRQMPFKEMVSAFHDYHFLRLGRGFDHFLQACRRAVLVARSADKKFGTSAAGKILVCVSTTF